MEVDNQDYYRDLNFYDYKYDLDREDINFRFSLSTLTNMDQVNHKEKIRIAEWQNFHKLFPKTTVNKV